MICVFDIETIPDEPLIRHAYGIEETGIAACQKAMELQREKTGSDFLPVPFHQVVAIAAVIADEFGNFIKVGNFPKEATNPDEAQLLQSFLSFLDHSKPKLVSFNGRSFDLPVMLIRALRYRLSCPAYFETNDPSANLSKWENYRQRYSEQFHVDLLDSLGNYGAARGLKLDDLCVMSGIPGKFDVSGDQVLDLHYAGEQDKIREYCESDVLNTYCLYLRYEILKGTLTERDYAKILTGFLENLPRQQNYSEVFVQFLQQELQKVSVA